MPSEPATPAAASASPARPGVAARAWQAVDHSRWMRAFVRYALMRGNLSAGGVTVSALLSLVAAMTIAVTVFRNMLAGRPQLYTWFVSSVNDAFPGLLTEGRHAGVIDPSTLALRGGVTPESVISALVLVWTATGVMTGLRTSIRSMFGLSGAPMRPVSGKLWDAVGILMLGAAVMLSSVLVAGSSGLLSNVLDRVGLTGDLGPLEVVLAVVIAGVVDAVVFLVLFRVAAKVRAPQRDRYLGAVLGAVGWGLLRLGGTALVGGWHNPLLASFAVLVTLLVWLNLGVRWCLYVAAWTANPPHTKLPVIPSEVHARETPNFVTLSEPATLAWPHHEVTGVLIPAPHDPDGAYRAED